MRNISIALSLFFVIFVSGCISPDITNEIKFVSVEPRENPSPWTMYRYDIEHSGVNAQEKLLAKETVNNLKPIWKLDGNGFFATSTIINNSVYFGELQSLKSEFYSLQLNDGSVKWKTVLEPVNNYAWDRGIAGSATYENGILYIVNH